MDIGALLILLAILLLMMAYLVQPFLTPRRRRVTMEEKRYSSLMAEYERVLGALQELDFDHRLGKIPEEEYPLLRAELLKKGTALLQELEALRERISEAEAERRLEATLEERHAQRTQESSAGLSDEELERLLARRRAARKGKGEGFCPACGHPFMEGDRFCSSCGLALHQRDLIRS